MGLTSLVSLPSLDSLDQNAINYDSGTQVIDEANKLNSMSPSYSSILTNGESPSTIPANQSPSIGSKIVNYVKNNPLSTALDFLTGQVPDPSRNGSDLEDIIFIILGLLLIAAGIFSFRSTGNVITLVSKTASKVAATAPEVAA